MKLDETTLRKYLLDDLSSAETEEVEMQILDDSDPETSLALAEHELIEDFIDENLSPAERALFQQNFLVSPRRKESVEFLKELKRHSLEVSANKKKSENKASLSAGFRAFFRTNFAPVAGFASLALIILIVGFWWFTGFSQPTELAKETAALNQKNLSDLSAYQNLPTLNLIPGVFRSNDPARALNKENLNENILLRLAVQGNYLSKPTVDLYRGEARLLTLKDVQIYQNPAGSEVRLLLPAKLEKGEYRLELQFENEKSVYNFVIR